MIAFLTVEARQTDFQSSQSDMKCGNYKQRLKATDMPSVNDLLQRCV